jgi:SAM-dependent methyltransferase
VIDRTTAPIARRAEKDYVLGTDDVEIGRLGVQHDIWTPRMLECWDRAGIEEGMRVLDVGCGPGYAALDLGQRVGPTGEVVGVERSQRFVTYGMQRCIARGTDHVHFVQQDVLEPLPDDFEASWCRWVASFVQSPQQLVANIAAALRPGGVAMFHEYVNYASWRMAPQRPLLEEFVAHVMASWRDAGGEPDVALQLPALLEQHGFRIRHVEPIAWMLSPQQPAWRWLASYIETGPERLRELKRVDAAWIERLHAELRETERTPGQRMMTPTVLEIIAEKA